MKITIIGSGNVAAALARAVSDSPFLSLCEVCARSATRGQELAKACGTTWVARPEDVAEADIYVIAVSDSAIGEVAGRLALKPGAVVAHTSGGLSIDALAPGIKDRAVLYPLQTFSAGRDVSMRDVPLFIEYSTPLAADAVSRLAASISEKVMEADSGARNRLHIAAVLAGNFSNHLYHLASQLLEESGTDLSILAPLIRETAEKAIESGSPAAVQTGPAARGDEVTLQRHLHLLEQRGDANMIEIYKLLSKSIWETSKRI